MNAGNSEALSRAQQMIRGIPAADADDRRAKLLARDPSGKSLFEDFIAQRGGGREPINGPTIAAAVLLDALDDGGAEIA